MSSNISHHSPHLWDELQDSIGEERPNGQADKICEYLGEVGLLCEGDEEQSKQGGEVDDSDGQKPKPPHCGRDSSEVESINSMGRTNHLTGDSNRKDTVKVQIHSI